LTNIAKPDALQVLAYGKQMALAPLRNTDMKDDQTTTLAEIKAAISAFAAERDWQQYHDPKNLVMAIASEVGELTEHFRWVTNEESHNTALDPQNAEAVAHELADVLMFALEFASVCGIDITSAISEKLRINADRYPVAKAKGSSRKYDQL
jgi:NTP pyrophosphatase (non-canonical NTP hydrolase)